MGCVLRGSSCDWRWLNYTDSLAPCLRFPPLLFVFPFSGRGGGGGGEGKFSSLQGRGDDFCNGLPFVWFLVFILGCLQASYLFLSCLVLGWVQTVYFSSFSCSYLLLILSYTWMVVVRWFSFSFLMLVCPYLVLILTFLFLVTWSPSILPSALALIFPYLVLFFGVCSPSIFTFFSFLALISFLSCPTLGWLMVAGFPHFHGAHTHAHTARVAAASSTCSSNISFPPHSFSRVLLCPSCHFPFIFTSFSPFALPSLIPSVSCFF